MKQGIRLQKYGAGFTLVEFLVAMAILAMVFGFGLFFSVDSYRGYAFRSERNLAVSVLQKARAQAMANIGQLPHGVHVDGEAKQYVIFEGSAYHAGSGGNIPVPFISDAISRAGMGDVLFNQLDGSITAVPAAWSFSGPAHASNINFNGEGLISWTN